jgi:anti-anti-sigma factor
MNRNRHVDLPCAGRTAERPVFRITGHVDLSNVDALGDAVRSAVGNQGAGITVDLSGVTYLDSIGISLLYRLFREFSDRQQIFTLVVPLDSVIRRVLIIGGVLAAIPTVHAAAPPLPTRDVDSRPYVGGCRSTLVLDFPGRPS